MSKTITMTFSDSEYAMIQRVANRRKSSFRSLFLRMCYDLDFKQQKRDVERGGFYEHRKRNHIN